MAQSLKQLKNLMVKYNPRADLELVELAYDFAKDAHKGQKRLSGEKYINHPLGVAITLAEMHASFPMIVAALLHDVPEDTEKTLKEVEKNFGKEVAFLVEGVTKLGKIKYRGMDRYIENLRKMFLAMAEDVRVILIKFADRIYNLKTLDALPQIKQYRIASEVLEIYAPIANRLGMGIMKGQLEDLAFPYVYPEEYQWVKKIADDKYPKKEKYIENIIKIVKKEIKKEKEIKVISLHGRTKHLYSLYKKLLKYNKDIDKIYDLVALRFVVNDDMACYVALSVIHRLWTPLKGRFKDYISQPKPNGYKSLHTTVFGEDGEIIEFQIRTKKMHQEAEYGIAAHWHYDEKGAIKPNKNLAWVQELVQWREETGRKQYLENLKIDVFQTRIFVFTPKGDVIDLPDDSTPIDFAYHVHTEIGDKCVGAMVNDQIVPLDKKLNSGDVIEIIMDKNRKGPNQDWLKFVKTSIARHKIKRHAKKRLLDWKKIINIGK